MQLVFRFQDPINSLNSKLPYQTTPLWEKETCVRWNSTHPCGIPWSQLGFAKDPFLARSFQGNCCPFTNIFRHPRSKQHSTTLVKIPQMLGFSASSSFMPNKILYSKTQLTRFFLSQRYVAPRYFCSLLSCVAENFSPASEAATWRSNVFGAFWARSWQRICQNIWLLYMFLFFIGGYKIYCRLINKTLFCIPTFVQCLKYLLVYVQLAVFITFDLCSNNSSVSQRYLSTLLLNTRGRRTNRIHCTPWSASLAKKLERKINWRFHAKEYNLQLLPQYCLPKEGIKPWATETWIWI